MKSVRPRVEGVHEMAKEQTGQEGQEIGESMAVATVFDRRTCIACSTARRVVGHRNSNWDLGLLFFEYSCDPNVWCGIKKRAL